MKDFINLLREQAIYVKLKANDKYGGAVDVESLLKVLRSIQDSYEAYIEAQFYRTYQQPVQKIYRKELKKIKEAAALLIVDLEFKSFDAALSPNLVTHPYKPQYINSIVQWKETTFKNYKKEVFSTDYNSEDFIKQIIKKYTPEERVQIYKPITENLLPNRDYKVHFGDNKKKYTLKFKSIQKKTRTLIFPKVEKLPVEDKIVHVYLTTTGDYDLFGQKLKIKKIHSVEELDQPVYPYQTKVIEFENMQLVFKEFLMADVSYDSKEDLFYISYSPLEITVWGESREEAQEAFDFAFVSMYKNYVNTDDKLTDKAHKLAKKLSGLVKQSNKI